MSEIVDFVVRQYHCRICGITHEIQLRKSICEKHKKFPFSHIFLHGELKNILTTLYLDKDMQIRGVDVQQLGEDDIFSKEQVISITGTLMEEVERLRIENMKLQKELDIFRKKVKQSYF